MQVYRFGRDRIGVAVAADRRLQIVHQNKQDIGLGRFSRGGGRDFVCVAPNNAKANHR